MRQPRHVPRCALLAWALSSCLVACDHKPEQLSEIPAELEPQVERARRAASDLKKTLVGRVSEAVQKGGFDEAIDVCSKQAKQLTHRVGERHGVRIGRTSHRLRNPENRSREWLSQYLSDVAGKKVTQVSPAVYDLDDRIGLVQPLGTKALCTQCHGDPQQMPPEVRRQLVAHYPKDQATGFATGDVRGVLWVEVPK